MPFEILAERIQKLLATKRPLIVAVSGFGGSGKTTLAEDLRKHFSDSTLLQLDNFLVNRGGGDGWRGGYDWTRFEQVLKDIESGKDLHYQWYNWEKNETKDWIDQPLPALVIVEGVRIMQPSLTHYFDLTVWIDKSLADATEQGKQRDRDNKPDEGFDIEAHIRKWDEVWSPKEKEFAALFDPAQHADILYSY